MQAVWRTVVVMACLLSGEALAADWPQLQRDAARTGRTMDEVAPPFRARWIWLGPAQTLRNNQSAAGWPDDLTSRSGYSYPVPAAVPFTISGSAQPVVSGGRVFIGTMEGGVYAIDANDGTTLWSAVLPGGTMGAGAVDGTRVIFCGLGGDVVAYESSTGAVAWRFRTHRAVTASPCIDAGTVMVADHGGWVYALNAQGGGLLWRSRLPAPVQGGIAIGSGKVYLGAEDMNMYALDLSTGTVLRSHRVRGQSFRLNYPVLFNNRVWIQTAMVPAVGSEYVMENLMKVSSTLAAEEANITRWLAGDTTGGIGADASPDWKHLFVLDGTTLEEPFTVPCGPVEGVGMPPQPVVVDNKDRVITWWKTRFPALTHIGAFGTDFSLDIAAVDQTTGKRVTVGAGFSNMWPGPESDNLYAFSVGGNVLWLRQNFRGTQTIHLQTSAHRFVSAAVRNRDGGTFNADVVYVDQGSEAVATAQQPLEGRMAPSIVGTRVYQSEYFGVTCLEHKP